MSELSLETLAAQAGERITDFELVRDVVLQYRERDENSIGIEPFEAGNGFVYCIDSRVSVLGEKDQPDLLQLDEDGTLHRTRTYNPLGVRADFVGLWPEAKEAALYRAETSFTPAGEHAETSFKEAAVRALSEDLSAERYRQQMEAADGSIMLSRGYPNDAKILASPDTRLIASPYAVNQIDKEVAVNLRLTGRGFINLPTHHLARVTNNGISIGPRGLTKLAIELPDDHPNTTQLRLNEGTVPAVNDEGYITRPGKRDDVPTHNTPSIDIFDALGLAVTEPEWWDYTSAFLENAREKLLKQFAIHPDESYKKIITQARQAIESHLANYRVEPRAIGCLAFR